MKLNDKQIDFINSKYEELETKKDQGSLGDQNLNLARRWMLHYIKQIHELADDKALPGKSYFDNISLNV